MKAEQFLQPMCRVGVYVYFYVYYSGAVQK